MFCTKCGKPTENNQTLCNDCLQASAQAQPQQAYQQPQYQQAYQQPQYQQAPYQPQYQQPYQPQYQQPYYAPQAPKVPALTKPTLGKAITSMILSNIALCLMTYILIYIDTYSYSYYYSYYYYSYWDPTYSIIMIMLFLAPAIIGTVFGAKSLGGSKLVLQDGSTKKHLPTFILGLAGMIQGILALLLAFISFIYAVTA